MVQFTNTLISPPSEGSSYSKLLKHAPTNGSSFEPNKNPCPFKYSRSSSKVEVSHMPMITKTSYFEHSGSP